MDKSTIEIPKEAFAAELRNLQEVQMYDELFNDFFGSIPEDRTDLQQAILNLRFTKPTYIFDREKKTKLKAEQPELEKEISTLYKKYLDSKLQK